MPAPIRTFLTLLLAVSSSIPLLAQQTSAEPTPEVFLGVRVLKTAAETVDWSVELPASCEGCRLILNEFTSAQNPREFYFHLGAPAGCTSVEGIHIKTNPAAVRGVVAGRNHVPFRKVADGVMVDVPCHDGLDLVAELHTVIESPAVRLRVEHADEQRRRGPYAEGPWPAVQRQAALNLQFAAREAVTALKLDQKLIERRFGVLHIMGFDTNYPTLGPRFAHSDFPPHWHLMLSWPGVPTFRVVDRILIGEDGLLQVNMATKAARVEGPQKDGKIERGQTLEILAPSGEVIFTEMITSQGYFTLGTNVGRCVFVPIAEGFDSGVALACPRVPAKRIRVEDDLALGRISLYFNDRVVEQHDYDPDTGALLRSRINRK